MKISLVICLAGIMALLNAPIARGGDAGSTELIGLYVEADATWQCWHSSGPFSVSTMYLILQNPIGSELHAWQAGITFEGEVLLGDISLSGDATNSGSGSEFYVELATPLPTDPITVLASIDVVPLQWDYICIFLTGVSDPPDPAGDPIVWTSATESHAVSVDGLDELGAVQLGECPVIIPDTYRCIKDVANEDMIWGAVKERYR